MIIDLTFRPEEPRDIEQVREIIQAAFPTDVESRLVDVLRANGKAIISLVAVKGDEVLGHILFSPVTTTPPRDSKGIGLAPVAVRPDARSRGIGSRLIREGLRRCKDLGYDYCVVLGAPDYYQRFGFERASPLGIRNEFGVDHEFMVVRFSDLAATGLVQYATEFSMFSV